MKTKLSLLVFFITQINTTHLSAQKFYATLAGGYAFSAPGNVIGTNYIFDLTNPSATRQENVYGTLGRGFNTSAIIGYMLTDYIAVETGYSYLAMEGHETGTGDPRYPEFYYLTELNSKMSRVFAALKITGGIRFKPYCKLGFMYGIGTEVTIDGVSVPYVSFNTYSGGSAPGGLGALGVEYKLKGRFWIFLEGNILYQVFSPDKLEVYDLTDTNTYELVDNWQTNNATQKLRQTFSFSSIGINAGIKFSFGGK